jgi:hypothetical protein
MPALAQATATEIRVAGRAYAFCSMSGRSYWERDFGSAGCTLQSELGPLMSEHFRHFEKSGARSRRAEKESLSERGVQ